MSSLIAPLATFLLGIIASYFAVIFDFRKSRNQELIKKRIQIYDALAPMLNDLLCHIRCIGDWKSIPPAIAIAHKRVLDRQMHLYGHFFSAQVRQHYAVYIDSCFATFQGAGRSAKLRANLSRLKGNWGTSWHSEWDANYVPTSEAVNISALQQEYSKLIKSFARDVGVKHQEDLRTWVLHTVSALKDRRLGLPAVLRRPEADPKL